MYDEILFNVDSEDISQVNIIKLDSLYHLRPSLYRGGEMTITDRLNIDNEIIDTFDSIFMSAVTSLILKKVKLDNSFISLLVSIIYFELRISIDESDRNVYELLEYLKEYDETLRTIFKELDKYNPGDIIEVTFYYNDNKTLAYAMVAKV